MRQLIPWLLCFLPGRVTLAQISVSVTHTHKKTINETIQKTNNKQNARLLVGFWQITVIPCRPAFRLSAGFYLREIDMFMLGRC